MLTLLNILSSTEQDYKANQFIMDAIQDIISDSDWEEVDVFCFKSGTVSCNIPSICNPTFSIDLDLIGSLDYGTIRSLQEESRKNGFGGVTAGLKITPLAKAKKPPTTDSVSPVLANENARSMPIKPLSNLYKNYSLRTIYASNYAAQSHLNNPSWGIPCLTLSLEPALRDVLPELISKTLATLERGRLHRPLDKICQPKSRSSRSASASASTSAAPHREHSPHWIDDAYMIETLSGNCSLCEDSSDEVTETSSEEGYGTISSSESEVVALLKKEAKRTLEKNKEFLRSSRESSTSSASRKEDSGYFLEDYASGRQSGYADHYYYMCYSPSASPLPHRKLSMNESFAEIKLAKMNSCSAKDPKHKETKVNFLATRNAAPATNTETRNNGGKRTPKREDAKKDKQKKPTPSPKKRENPVQLARETKKGKQQVPKTNRRREFEEDRYFSHGVGFDAAKHDQNLVLITKA